MNYSIYSFVIGVYSIKFYIIHFTFNIRGTQCTLAFEKVLYCTVVLENFGITLLLRTDNHNLVHL